MELKVGVKYDAIHKKQTYLDGELGREFKRSMVVEIGKKGFFYHDVYVYESFGGEIKKDDMISVSQWDFYEIRDKENETYRKNIDDLLAVQRLAVELKNKDLFEKCKIDLTYLGYKTGVV